MPRKAPRICGCGHRVEAGIRCPCERSRDATRKAKFDRSRPNSSQRGYNRQWEQVRKAFLREHPFCRYCGEPADTVDHIRPHRGDSQLFWDRTNWQPLCTEHHSRAKQIEERRTVTRK